jgi:peptidoglycan LD-endopeptidase LytH
VTCSATPVRLRWGFCLAIALILAAIPGCRAVVDGRSPHESYANKLRETGLDKTALGQDWLRAAMASLERPLTVQTPFKETGYFAPEEAGAVAYQLELRRGRQLSVELSVDSSTAARVFVDLFTISSDDIPQRVAFLEAERSSLVYEVEKDGRYVLRVQPELLRGVRFTVVQRALASLPFPIPGESTATVQSTFGVTRGAGARLHEGIDIFVPKGTAVAAVTAGFARPSQNTLGGSVVWLHEWPGGRTFYYAHLDRWAIDGLTRVRAGDVLGYVGNTGNARTTPPHLHFGIYQRGAIDPLPFLQADDEQPPPPVRVDFTLGTLVRTNVNRARLRTGSSAQSPSDRLLTRHTIARLSGISTTSVRVSLPDGTVGYVSAASVSGTSSPVRRTAVLNDTPLHEWPTASSPIVNILDRQETADFLGTFDDYALLKPPDGRAGWAHTRTDGGA